MSWFQSVVNIIKDLPSTINKLTSFIITPRSAALPYVDEKRYGPSKSGASGSVDNDNESNDENDSEGYDSSGEGTSQSAGAARITTRARITYELDRYEKNAMMVFVQILSDPPDGCRIKEFTNQEVGAIVEAFVKFRFAVSVHINLTCSEIEQKCDDYFAHDFGEFGAVVVMVLSFDGGYGQLSALDGRFSESVILRHLTDDLNPTLVGKPKIYITEANRTLIREQQQSLPLEEQYEDVLKLHIPCIFSETAIRRPLLLLCDNINEMGDSSDFVTILRKTVDDATSSIGMFEDKPIQLSNSLTKVMRLASISDPNSFKSTWAAMAI